MRAVDAVLLLAPIVGVCVGGVMAMRRKLVRRYERLGAFAPDTAAAPAPLRGPMRFWRRRLLDSGELRALPDGREWLDLEVWQRHRKTRRARALGAVSVLVALLLLVAWFAATRG